MKRLNEQFVMRLSAEDRRRLDELARVSQMSPAAVVRTLVRTARIAPAAVFFHEDVGATKPTREIGAIG